ncbi:MAG: hypothetical protein JW931_08670 [Methanomicrobiaceae archaeon]|nr:hypothetical protein [Methanomicrobiaceae archaeon]
MNELLIKLILTTIFLQLILITGANAELEIRQATALDDAIIMENEVSQEAAYLGASHELLTFIESNICCDPPDTWEGAYVKKEDPLKIYDISGFIQYYDFDIVRNETVVGIIRTAANKLVGGPVPVVYCSPMTKSRSNLTYYADYYQNRGCSVTIISPHSGSEQLFVECNDPEKNSFIFDPWWLTERSNEYYKSFYKDYTFDPKAAVNQYDQSYSINVGDFPLDNETEVVTPEPEQETVVNSTCSDLPENTVPTKSPGFSGILAITVMALFIFACKRS